MLSVFHQIFTRKIKKNTKVLLTAHVRGLRMTRKNAFNFRHVWLHFLSSSQPSMLYSSVLATGATGGKFAVAGQQIAGASENFVLNY